MEGMGAVPLLLLVVVSSVGRLAVRAENPSCLLPRKPGLCKAYMPSYFYNSTSQQCEGFIYGGCGGNANRFRSEVECREACKSGASRDVGSLGNEIAVQSRPENPCLLPGEPGRCYAYMPRYFYNSTSQECEEFIYGGCGGNANRFESAIKCRQTCKAEVVCQQEAVTGQCRAYFPSFFYNSTSGQCEPFIYGGCGGNDNRFRRKSRCMAVCMNDASGANPDVDNPMVHVPNNVVVQPRSASSDAGDRAMPGSSDD